MEQLKVTAVSKNSAIQRAGWAGRQSAGKCFWIYSHEIYEEMEQSSPPEILRSNLAKVILQLKAVGINNVEEFDFLDRPSDIMFS